MSEIQWTDETWNPTIGCRKVSAGCKNCYAMAQAKRVVHCARGQGRDSPYEEVLRMDDDGKPRAEWNGSAVFLPERLEQPMRWKGSRRVFVDSMSDLFHPDIEFAEIAAVWGVMAACPQHTFQVLTKRPERALEFFRWVEDRGYETGEGPLAALSVYALFRDYHDTLDKWGEDGCPPGGPDHILRAPWSESNPCPTHEIVDAKWPLPNVWLGTSCEDQATADERIPPLLDCPASVRFVSAEPLLGPVDILPYMYGGKTQCPHCLKRFLTYEAKFCGGCSVDTAQFSGYESLICPSCKKCGCKNVPNWKPNSRESRGEFEFETRGVGDWSLIDWVIVGGESGTDARPCDVGWIKSIVDQCQSADVPVFVKQLGSDPVREKTKSEFCDEFNGFLDESTGDFITPAEKYDMEWGSRDDCFPLTDIEIGHPKGGDPDEWPEDLRVRQMPEVHQ